MRRVPGHGQRLRPSDQRLDMEARGLTVETVTLEDSREILGVNSRKELAEVGAILRTTKLDALMAAGVLAIVIVSRRLDRLLLK